MVDVAAVGCFASLAEATRYRPRAFLRRGFCRVDDALRWASTSTSSSFTVLGVDPYLGVGSISDSLSLDDNYPGREKRITADSRPRRRRGLRGPPPSSKQSNALFNEKALRSLFLFLGGLPN